MQIICFRYDLLDKRSIQWLFDKYMYIFYDFSDAFDSDSGMHIALPLSILRGFKCIIFLIKYEMRLDTLI